MSADNIALSNKERASLTEPSEILTISLSASSEILPSSFSLIFLIYVNNSELLTLAKSNLWHLDIIVIGTFFISVVANINFRYSGGSSKVLRREFHACLESMWHSSKI